jgi:threonine dehydrogenase-like Zn-dependent dehydrogenase
VIVADINESRLELALKMGADVVINTKEQNLKDEIMKLTNGDGIARLVEASGATQMLNMSFSLLRKVKPQCFCLRGSQSTSVDFGMLPFA